MDACHAEPPRHFLQGKTIFVAGGGIAGLALVAGLRKLWDPELAPPTVVIFERDSCDPLRRRVAEYFTLSLTGHSEAGGLVALQKLGLVDSVLGRAVAGRDDDEASGAFKIWGADWGERMRIRRTPLHGLPTANIRISRGDLRQVLLDAAMPQGDDAWQESHVRWESQCLDFEGLDDGRLRVRIRRRTSLPAVREGVTHHDDDDEGQECMSEQRVCDVLVAADGANSKLRAFVRPWDTLEYAGAVLRGALSVFPAGGVPTPPGRDWGFVVSDSGVSCFVSPVNSRTVFWALGNLEHDPVLELRSGSNRDQAKQEADPAAVLARSEELGAVFGSHFAALAAQTELKTLFCTNARDKRAFAHDELLAGGSPVVFIGDGNHALSPFAGFGANLALADGWDLAEQLCRRAGDGDGSLAGAVAAYDAVSGPRAEKVLAASRRTVRAAHGMGWWAWFYWVVLVVGRCVAWAVGLIRHVASMVVCGWSGGGGDGAGAGLALGAPAGAGSGRGT